MDFFEASLAQRDAAGFTAACRRPGSLTDFAIDSLVRRRRNVGRVLVIDGRCLCKNNGIGNLFGDYVTWFTVALLADRALFIDWTDSTSPRDRSRIGSEKHASLAKCLSSGRSGNVCHRVSRRFDLGAHFAAIGDDSWQWTEHARARVEATHGNASETTLFSRNVSNPMGCADVTEHMLGGSPWLTIRVTDETATALVPFCLTQRRRTDGRPSIRGYPDPLSARRLLDSFHSSLLATGSHAGRAAAARLNEEQLATRSPRPGSGASGAEPRRVGIGQALWNAPLAPLVEIPTTERAVRKSFYRQGMSRTALGAALASQGQGELPLLGMLTSCLLHAYVRPLPHLRAHLAPLLARVGNASLVTLQLRTGWADDTQEVRRGRGRLGPRPASALDSGLQTTRPCARLPTVSFPPPLRRWAGTSRRRWRRLSPPCKLPCGRRRRSRCRRGSRPSSTRATNHAKRAAAGRAAREVRRARPRHSGFGRTCVRTSRAA